MPEVLSLKYSDPFGFGTSRPYLVLRLTGPHGASGEVPGLVDSGADATSLPLEYASHLGYGPNDLDIRPFMQAGGEASCYVATLPSTAFVVGIERMPFTIMPTFIDGASMVLWGRADLFREFGVIFDEVGQRFSLVVPD